MTLDAASGDSAAGRGDATHSHPFLGCASVLRAWRVQAASAMRPLGAALQRTAWLALSFPQRRPWVAPWPAARLARPHHAPYHGGVFLPTVTRAQDWGGCGVAHSCVPWRLDVSTVILKTIPVCGKLHIFGAGARWFERCIPAHHRPPSPRRSNGVSYHGGDWRYRGTVLGVAMNGEDTCTIRPAYVVPER